MSPNRARSLLTDPPGEDLVAALRVVLAGYRRDGWLNIDQMARLADVSVRTLQRALAAKDLAYSEVVDKVRAELAIELLKSTDISVHEIAKEVGYSAPSNFSRAFKRWTGTAPCEFRRDCLTEKH